MAGSPGVPRRARAIHKGIFTVVARSSTPRPTTTAGAGLKLGESLSVVYRSALVLRTRLPACCRGRRGWTRPLLHEWRSSCAACHRWENYRRVYGGAPRAQSGDRARPRRGFAALAALRRLGRGPTTWRRSRGAGEAHRAGADHRPAPRDLRLRQRGQMRPGRTLRRLPRPRRASWPRPTTPIATQYFRDLDASPVSSTASRSTRNVHQRSFSSFACQPKTTPSAGRRVGSSCGRSSDQRGIAIATGTDNARTTSRSRSSTTDRGVRARRSSRRAAERDDRLARRAARAPRRLRLARLARVRRPVKPTLGDARCASGDRRGFRGRRSASRCWRSAPTSTSASMYRKNVHRRTWRNRGLFSELGWRART